MHSENTIADQTWVQQIGVNEGKRHSIHTVTSRKSKVRYKKGLSHRNHSRHSDCTYTNVRSARDVAIPPGSLFGDDN